MTTLNELVEILSKSPRFNFDPMDEYQLSVCGRCYRYQQINSGEFKIIPDRDYLPDGSFTVSPVIPKRFSNPQNAAEYILQI